MPSPAPAAAGTYTFKATSGGQSTTATGSVSITAGTTATQLVFSTQPGGSVAEGTAFTQPVLTAEDANGNTVTGFNSSVTLAVAAYTAGNGGNTQGSIGACTNPVTAANGVATFSGCDFTGTAGAGTYTLKASGGSLTSATSTGTVTVTAGGVSTLTFSTQPTGPVNEFTNFTTQPAGHGHGRQRQHREWRLGHAGHLHLRARRRHRPGHPQLHQQHGDHVGDRRRRLHRL